MTEKEFYIAVLTGESKNGDRLESVPDPNYTVETHGKFYKTVLINRNGTILKEYQNRAGKVLEWHWVLTKPDEERQKNYIKYRP